MSSHRATKNNSGNKEVADPASTGSQPVKKAYPSPFRAFTFKYSQKVNRLDIPIEISKAFDPKSGFSEKFEKVKAIIDTGATNSVLRTDLVTRLNLQPIGAAKVNHAGGSNTSPTYLVNIILPNRVLFPFVVATLCSREAADFDVIIGMDILSSGDISIGTIDDKTTLSFRTPAYESHDFVKEGYRIQYKGINPNDPCPCGKVNERGFRLKFRDCHSKLM